MFWQNRIPLYIPPYVVTEGNVEIEQKLENLILDSLHGGDLDAHMKFSSEQEELHIFHPVMKHSFSEMSKTVVFHPQLINDFLTIEKIGWELLKELDR